VTWLLVALGAAVGAPARYLVDRAVQARHESAVPWGTWLVNVAGSFVLGLLTGLLSTSSGDQAWAALIGTGFCGALTTYSTFGYELLRLLQTERSGAAVRYLAVSLTAGVAAAAAGVLLGGLLGGG
jgi:fluoride exporter